MGKHERGTPKDIANRIKSKGLQKLRWFCQMCQKQCRDQNGFKCHLTSESHQRQLLLVAENTNSFLRQFSKEFEANFMQILKTCFGTKRVRANEVYQEYIKDKGHVHMNSTVWHTLTGFVLYLGKSGKCKIDQNEKGWYIQYIDQEEVIRKAEEAKRMKAEKDDEERQQEMINAQVRRALEKQGEVFEPQATELMRSDDSEKITLNLNLDKKPTLEDLKRPVFSGVSIFDQIKTKKEEPVSDEERPSSSRRDRSRERDEKRYRRDRDTKKERRSRSRSRSRSRDRERERRAGSSGKERPFSSSKREEKPKKSALDEIREQQERFKEKKNRKDHWLHEGIIVKIITKALGNDYYKAKGVVKSLIDDYTASVKLDDGTLVKLDQAHVETVIPSVGREMKIVNGAYREMAIEELVVKGSLKLKKKDVFKKKKKKTVDPKMIDLTIKKDEQSGTVGKTKAEIAFERRRQETLFERMQKKAAVSHRQRVEEFNKQMSELTEFNDIPKVSWTK
ncbi:DNA/RNA-binding protein KIN17 [Trichostrongylus colubriformis]|uniref:DNA/RNA-binding protein KIN17 n=1 Tax=Trichostrongylus colubriformis TaxID=6319 RepID=A0AAN8G3J4_TRICO